MNLILRIFFSNQTSLAKRWTSKATISKQWENDQCHWERRAEEQKFPGIVALQQPCCNSSSAHSAAAFTSCYVLETLSQSPWKWMKWFLFLLFVRCPWFDSFQRRKGRASAIPSAESSCTCWEGSEDPQPRSWLKHIYSISREAHEETKGNVIPLSLFPIC